MNEDAAFKSIDKFRKLLKKTPKLQDAKYVHDLRTRSRKFESMLTALEPTITRRLRRLLRDVKRVRSRAGKVRDMDVLTGNVAGIQQTAGKENHDRDCLIQLLEHLGGQRKRQAKKLRRVLATHRSDIRRGLKRNEKKLRKKIAKHGARARAAAAEAAARVLQLSSGLHRPPRLNRSNLHKYRLKLKQLRYILRLGENAGHTPFANKLSEVNDAIGEWHDWEELVAIAERIQSHDGACGLVLKLKESSQRKFEGALLSATQLRKQFLPGSSGARGNASQAATPPVLEAAADLAA